MKRKRNSSDSADLFAASLVQSSGDGGAGNMEDRARVALISSPLVVETEDWLWR